MELEVGSIQDMDHFQDHFQHMFVDAEELREICGFVSSCSANGRMRLCSLKISKNLLIMGLSMTTFVMIFKGIFKKRKSLFLLFLIRVLLIIFLLPLIM